MSGDFFLACKKCKQLTPIASDSDFSEWKWHYTPDKAPVNFIALHVAHVERLRIVRKNSREWQKYELTQPGDPDYSHGVEYGCTIHTRKESAEEVLWRVPMSALSKKQRECRNANYVSSGQYISTLGKPQTCFWWLRPITDNSPHTITEL